MLNNEFSKQAENLSKKIEEGLRILLPGYTALDKAAITLVLFAASSLQAGIVTYREAIASLPENIKADIYHCTKVDVVWDDVKQLLEMYKTEDFLQVLLSVSDNDARTNPCNVPASLNQLAERFLRIKSEPGKGLQLYSGSGDTLTGLVCRHNNLAVTGLELSRDGVLISKLKAFALGVQIEVIRRSPIDYCLEGRGKADYDFVISTHPFGLRVRTLSNKFPELSDIYPFLRSGTAADWVCGLLALDNIAPDGKVVAFFSEGCMFTNQDREVRKYLVHNGLVEAVIALPAKMYSYMSLKPVMVVLSRGNKEVKMVDASDMFTPGRRQNEFSEENIEAIIDAYNHPGEKSVCVTVDDLSKSDYTLLPTRFLAVPEAVIKNGRPLEELVRFGRSVAITASALDKLSVDENDASTNYYLRLSEVHDGMVDNRLPKISCINKKYEKYLLEDNDIILSRNGSPFKVALFNEQAGTKVLPVGNLLILRADTSKINPIYLKAYLESEQGIAGLSALLTGVAMQVISLERLKKMLVPVPDMEEQNEIAEKYLSIVDELKILNLKIMNAKDRLRHVIDNGKAGE